MRCRKCHFKMSPNCSLEHTHAQKNPFVREMFSAFCAYFSAKLCWQTIHPNSEIYSWGGGDGGWLWPNLRSFVKTQTRTLRQRKVRAPPTIHPRDTIVWSDPIPPDKTIFPDWRTFRIRCRQNFSICFWVGLQLTKIGLHYTSITLWALYLGARLVSRQLIFCADGARGSLALQPEIWPL